MDLRYGEAMAALTDSFLNFVGLLCGVGAVSWVVIMAAVMFAKWVSGIADGFDVTDE